MRTRSVLAIGAVASAALVAAALPASADAGNYADTTVTFTVASGELSISAPASADLGSMTIGDSSLSAQLGLVTVTDLRGSTEGWVSAVTATDFTTGGGAPNETVRHDEVEYWSGPALATTGFGVFMPGQPTALDAVPLDGLVTGFSAAGTSGANSATWNPTLIVNLPSAALAGVYTGTVTHSAL
jgi:hypothetical protein